MTTPLKYTPAFEYETCSRCHGSGRFSFCERFRDVCFKCSGNGVALTKRGEAAQRYYSQLCTKMAKNLTVGEVVRAETISNNGQQRIAYQATVTAILEKEPIVSVFGESSRALLVVHNHPKMGRGSILGGEDMEFFTYSNKAENLVKAKEYQATLTKAGKPSKRAVKQESSGEGDEKKKKLQS